MDGKLVFSILPLRDHTLLFFIWLGADRCQIDSFICVFFHKYFDHIHSAKKIYTHTHIQKKGAREKRAEFRGQNEWVFIKLSACRY